MGLVLGQDSTVITPPASTVNMSSDTNSSDVNEPSSSLAYQSTLLPVPTVISSVTSEGIIMVSDKAASESSTTEDSTVSTTESTSTSTKKLTPVMQKSESFTTKDSTVSSTVSTTSTTQKSTSKASSTSTTRTSTVNPLLCSKDAVPSCVANFTRLYVPSRGNKTYDDEDQEMYCTSKKVDAEAQMSDCFDDISAHNCTTLKAVFNHTAFGLRCSSDGLLKHTAWTPQQCPDDFVHIMNVTTARFCSMSNHSLICKQQNISNSSWILSINKTSLLAPLLAAGKCTPTPTTQIPLLANPVSPQAMTAIVVCVCLFIISILAGFFFWPKCHMSKAAVAAAAKEIKATKTAATGESSAQGRSDGRGSASYNASQGVVVLGGASQSVVSSAA